MIDKQVLAKILDKNLSEHRAKFEKGIEGFRKLVVEEMEKNLADAKAGRKIQCSIYLKCPEDHTEDYERVIRMCELEHEDLMELTTHEFDCYVMDRWPWMEQFTATNAGYLNAG